MIHVSGLSFEYSGKRVLHDIGFEIKQGSVTALVGPNGAGKTTLLRCIAALEKPITGTIIIDGVDVSESPREIHRRTGYLSDFFGLYNRLTVEQCLTYQAWCQNLPETEIPARIRAIAQDLVIEDQLDKKASTLSRGYRQRLGVALALLHEPKILILDEPASGLDPEARIQLSALMQRLKQRNMTIIVSSHILAELEDYCTDMLVLRDGVVADHISLEQHVVDSAGSLKITLTADATPHVRVLEDYDGIRNVKASGNVLECIYSGNEAGRANLIRHLIEKGVPVSGFEVQHQSLQEAYMNIAESKKRGGKT